MTDAGHSDGCAPQHPSTRCVLISPEASRYSHRSKHTHGPHSVCVCVYVKLMSRVCVCKTFMYFFVCLHFSLTMILIKCCSVKRPILSECINRIQSTNYLNTWRSLSPAKLLVCEGTSMGCSCCTQQKSTPRNLLLTSKIFSLAFHLIGNRRSARSLSVCLSSVRVQEKLITAKSGSIAVKHCSEEKRKSSKTEKKTRSDSDVLLFFRVLIPPHMPCVK